MQAQALRTCLGLPRCASTAATIAIAREHPIRTYVATDTLRNHLRHLSRLQSQRLASLSESRPHATFSGIVTSYRSSLPSDFTPAARPPCPLWCLRQPQVRLSIPGVTKKSDLPTCALNQATLHLLHDSYSDRIHIYTDGSSTLTSSTGAVVIPSASFCKKFKISHITTSTGSELAALRSAVLYVHGQSPNQWAIFCDSKAALQSLLSALRRSPYEQLVAEIRLHYHQAVVRGHDIVFQWLPAHCNITGNECADKAAREAHDECERISMPLSRTDAARHLRNLAHIITLRKWNTQEFTNRRLYAMDPQMQLQLVTGFKRQEETLLCRLRIGVSFTNSYSFLIGMADSANCSTCGVEETTRHLLCDCPRYDDERIALRTALGHLDDRPFTEEKILGPWPRASAMCRATKALLRFLKNTGLYDRL